MPTYKDIKTLKEEGRNAGEQPDQPKKTAPKPQVRAYEAPQEENVVTDASYNVFPKPGEPTEPYEKKFGNLEISELQLPAIKTWNIGGTYDLKVKVLLRETRIRQDTEWDDRLRREIATSEPYVKGEFEIVSLSPEGGETEEEPEEDGDII